MSQASPESPNWGNIDQALLRRHRAGGLKPAMLPSERASAEAAAQAELQEAETQPQLPEGPHLRLLEPAPMSDKALKTALHVLEDSRRHIAHVTSREPSRAHRAGDNVSPKKTFFTGKHNQVRVAVTPEEVEQHLH